MNIQKTIYNTKCAVRSELFDLLLMNIVTIVMLAFTTSAYSQVDEWTVYNTSNSGLPYNGVTGLAVDAQGNVWIGTGKWMALAGGGLAKFDGVNWTIYNRANSELPHNDHTGLAIDPDGNIWSGTEGGLAKFDGYNWTVYTTGNSGLRNNLVSTPSFDAQGNLWIGSWGGGLANFDGTNWIVYTTGNSGLPHNRAWATSSDTEGNLWIGTVGGGLAKFDGINWTVYNTSNSGLPHNDVTSYSLPFDALGNLWIGTDGGLAKFDTQNWTVYNTANSNLPNNRVWALTIDAKDNIWIGTYGGGLVKFDGNKWTVFNKYNSGLPDNRVYSLAVDVQGNIWIGTESGGLAVYSAEAQPVFDFNGDEIVDSADMCMMVEFWHTDEPLYDIAPPPSGDGIVDVQDLILLSEHLFEEIFPPELIAYWKLDETEGDIAYDSARKNDASVLGGPVWQPEGGMVYGALTLDGMDDYIEAPFVLNPADGTFSVFAWIKGGAPGQVIISQMDGIGTGETWLGIDPVNGCLMTGLVAPPIGRFISQPLESNQIITDDIWHQIGLIWDGSYRTLYVDDMLVAEDTQNNLSSSLGGLNIGCGSNSEVGTFWSGVIDDIRIYNRAVRP